MNFDSGKTVTANLIVGLQDYILENHLQVGDALPSEEEIGRHFGVSRGIVREALQYFRTLDIIESRPRKGITIKTFLPDNPFAAYIPFCRDAGDSAAIRHMREIIERGISADLIAHATPEDLAELRRTAMEMNRTDLSAIKKLDLEFHRKLLDIVGNRFLNCLVPFVVDYFDSKNSANEPYYRDPAEYARNEMEKHLAITGAVEQHDEKLLQDLFQSHYHPGA